MGCVRAMVSHDRQVEGEWTGYSQPLERTLLKKNRYLDGKEQEQAAPAAAPAVPAAPKQAKPVSPFAEKLLGAIQGPPESKEP